MDKYIKKEYLTEHIKACWINGRPKYSPELHEVLEWIDEVPSEYARPVARGGWIDGKCSLCGEHAPYWCMASTYHNSNFCPNCGADMRAAEQEPLKVGDEVKNKDGHKGLILKVHDEFDYTIFDTYYQKSYIHGTRADGRLEKTGKSFPEIAEVLRGSEEKDG